ncbi:MAG: imidazole glycerol phosphate synthase subunit HisH [Nitrospirae bacterium]|nr:imidazole glycerol phosphate synthase subunit HisH [Nitrospirota bacterium]
MPYKPTIQIIDYGLGNLHSLGKAMNYLGVKAENINRPSALGKTDGIIIPGVGAFGEGMTKLKERGFIEPLLEIASAGKPILGICLGMQFFFSFSLEFGMHRGLNLIKGRVVPLVDSGGNPAGDKLKIPHIGWKPLLKRADAVDWNNTILSKIKKNEEVYFIHSFACVPDNEKYILAYAEYGNSRFAAVVKKGNIYGCQFHPEKSRETGIKILREFVKIVIANSKGAE